MRSPSQVTAVLTRPDVTIPAATEILARHWSIQGELRPLSSERDRNFTVLIDGQPRWVLKLSNLSDEPAFLELQALGLERLAEAGIPCPRIRPAADGRLVAATSADGGPPLARLLSWLPGVTLATVPPGDRRPELFRDLGRVMGTVAVTLRDFDHPAAHRDLQWDVLQTEAVVAAHADAVVDPWRRALLAAARARLDASLWRHLHEMPRSLIHNDANDHNLLVDTRAQRVAGLLDFGDMIHSVTANELAVACTYAMLDAGDPIGVAAAIVAGFGETCPLSGDELAQLPGMILARLATSVTLSAHQARLDPSDAYLTVSEEPAWRLLGRLLDLPSDLSAWTTRVP